MGEEKLIALARRYAGLSQRELAERSGTSQPTLSAYERGLKSPRLDVFHRLVNGSGYEVVLSPKVSFTTCEGSRGEPYVIPDRLWRLEFDKAFADVTLPTRLYWSGPSMTYRLGERRDRARVYEIVLREGGETDLLEYVDGALLVDLWGDLVLPRALREAWTPLMSRIKGQV